jgi:hypothetical protein
MTTKTKTILAFLIIFVVGFASGYLFSNSHSQDHGNQMAEQSEQQRWQHFRGGDRQEQSERYQQRSFNRLADQLGLDDNQRSEFYQKMREYRLELREEITEFRTSERETIKSLYESFRDDAGDILNTEQLGRLDSYLHPDSVRQNRSRNIRDRNR